MMISLSKTKLRSRLGLNRQCLKSCAGYTRNPDYLQLSGPKPRRSRSWRNGWHGSGRLASPHGSTGASRSPAGQLIALEYRPDHADRPRTLLRCLSSWEKKKLYWRPATSALVCHDRINPTATFRKSPGSLNTVRSRAVWSFRYLSFHLSSAGFTLSSCQPIPPHAKLKIILPCASTLVAKLQ
jgi:hypothetical protein